MSASGRSIALRVVALLTLAGVLAGCVTREATTTAAPAPETVPLSELSDVTLQIGDQKGGTESLLRAANVLNDLPYRIAFSTFTSGPPQVEAATAGKIDFAITGNTPPIFGAAANAKIKVVTAYENGGDGDRVVVRADSPIESVADLRGKSVAVGKGSSAHGHILAQLRQAGLTPEDVKLVFLQPADALTAFTSGQADAWAIWDPYTAQVEQQMPVRSIAQATGVANGAGFGIASDATLADPKRNTALSDLLVRYAKATRWAQDHPAEWARSYADAVGLALPVATVAQGRSLRSSTALSDQLIASEQKLADLFAETKQISSAPTFADAVDHRYDEVLKPFLTKEN